jgi:hypothetical protein
MAQHGGYRRPGKPAAVSGPGALSQRTDGAQPRMDLPDARYGEQARFQEVQAGADMAQAGPTPVPLDAPSQRPEEPVTAGAALGPGIGPEAAGILDDEQGTIEQLKPLLRSMEAIANLPNSTPQFRSFVRKLRAQAGE